MKFRVLVFLRLLLWPLLVSAEADTVTYEYYSPVQPVKSIMIGSIYAEDIHGGLIRSNEDLVDEIKDIVEEIDPNIEFIELVQESTPETDNNNQFSLRKNDDLCSDKICFGDFIQSVTFLRDPFLPVAVFNGNTVYTEMNVLSKYSCFGDGCAPTTKYKLKSVLGSGVVFNESLSSNENMGGNLLALPGRTFLSVDDGKGATKGSAFMYLQKFNGYKKIVLEGDELLGIGHVDEMIQIIPDPTSRCGASLIVASPKLFVEKFGNFKLSYFKDTGDPDYMNPDYQKTMDLANHIGHLFDEDAGPEKTVYAEYYKKLFNLDDKTATYRGVQSYLYSNKDKVTFKMLVAPYVDALEEKIQRNVDKIRNNYVCPSQDYFAKITIGGKQKLVKDSIRAARPDAALSVFRLPVMWLNSFSMTGKMSASSILPNFVNSVVIPKYGFYPGTSKLKSVNVHLLIPDVYTFDDIYRLYARKIIADQYLSIQDFIVKKNTAAKLNIEYKITLHFIDSSFYGVGDGDLHCASNEIRRFFYHDN